MNDKMRLRERGPPATSRGVALRSRGWYFPGTSLLSCSLGRDWHLAGVVLPAFNCGRSAGLSKHSSLSIQLHCRPEQENSLGEIIVFPFY